MTRRVAVAAVAALVLSACVGGPAAAPPSPSPSATPTVTTPAPTGPTSTEIAPAEDVRTLRYALDRDPASIEPGFTSDPEGELVVDALFDSLVRLGDDLATVEPEAAESWTVSEDGRTWVFTLRPGGRFHDDTPVVAEDFVRAFRRIVDGTSGRRTFAGQRLAAVVGYDAAVRDGVPLSGVRATGELELEIQLSRPDAGLLVALAHPTMGPVPPAAEEDPRGFGERPIGNGPFRMAEAWEHNQFIRVARTPGHREVPGVDEVVFRIYASSPGQAWDDLRTGLVDVATVPAEDVTAARLGFGTGEGGLVGPGLLDAPGTAIYHYGFNVAAAPFDDVRVRRAVSLVIDRDAVVTGIAPGTRRTLTAIVPPLVPGAQPGACAHCVHDPEAARALMAEVRDPDGDGVEDVVLPPVVLRVDRGETNAAIADLVATAMRDELGLEVAVETATLDDHMAALRAGEMQVFRSGWQGTTATTFLDPLFRSTSPDNLTGYANPEVDALLDAAAATGDDVARTAVLRQVESIVLGDVVVAPMHVYLHRVVVADVVEGFVLRPDGHVDLTDVRVERAA